MTRAEFQACRAAASCQMPMNYTGWALYLSVFLDRRIAADEAEKLIKEYNASLPRDPNAITFNDVTRSETNIWRSKV